ncbi:Uncharacterised protein [Segatella copri]|nr:Uncharacterised protein [Segatella copri]
MGMMDMIRTAIATPVTIFNCFLFITAFILLYYFLFTSCSFFTSYFTIYYNILIAIILHAR